MAVWDESVWYRSGVALQEAAVPMSNSPSLPLTPEEEAVDDADDVDDEIDDTLPADLWF